MAQVLVVDDDAIVRAIIVQFLQFGGHTAVEAASGTEALDYFEEASTDMVLTDLSMPGMSGLDLRRKLQEIAPDLPCVLMSGHIIDDNIREAFDAVLEKPLGCRELIDTVKQLVTAHIIA
jgi:CheY-like chemotaxis protein